MNILLINPYQRTKYPQPPMGLALLGAILERAGHKVAIWDLNHYSNWKMEIVFDLMGRMTKVADVVGVTAMTPTINNAIEVIKSVKNIKPEVKVVLGGVHATLMPEETKESYPEIDVVVKGEGDNAITEVLSKGVKGIYESIGKVNMDELPYLAYHLLHWKHYKPHPPHGRATPWLPTITSRGCPFSCSYCSKGVFGGKFRAQSPERVVDEMVYLQERFGVKEIAFYDDVFTLDRKRVYGICEEILSRGLKLSWTCETRADLVDGRILGHMARAGCYSISYGIESGSQDVLDIIGKGITLEQSAEAVERTKEAGIQGIGYFMIGSPNETPETIKQTIGFAKRLQLDYAQFSITTPYPHTKLWDYYKDGHEDMDVPWENFVYAGTGSRVSPIFESKELSRGDMGKWVSRAYREFYLRPSYVCQRLSGIHSLGDVKVLAKGLGMLRGM